jgi:hypothetical protein
MLETYTDSLKAAKLEGKTLGFHWNTVLDTLKSVSRATIEVKNADPLARVTALLGFVLLILVLVGSRQMPFDPIIWKFISPLALFYAIGLASFTNCFYEMRQKWIMPLMLMLSALTLLIRLYFEQFYPFQIGVLYYPQMNPYAIPTLLVLGYISKILGVLVLMLIVGGIAIDAVEKRRILPMNSFTLSFILLTFVITAFGLQNQSSMTVLNYLSFVYLVVWFGAMIFITLRLWQQPRAAPRVVKAT